jgi:hypothetical protein
MCVAEGENHTEVPHFVVREYRTTDPDISIDIRSETRGYNHRALMRRFLVTLLDG